MVKYYYDRYQAIENRTYYEPQFVDGGFIDQRFSMLYKSYQWNSVSKSFSLSSQWGSSEDVRNGSIGYSLAGGVLTQYTSNNPDYVYSASSGIPSKIRTKDANKATYSSTYSRGNLVQSDIVAEDTIYPVNGRHTDGYWYVRKNVVNTAPTQPGAFTQPIGTLKAGDSVVISWGASTDANGNFSKYILEAAINGGTWTQIATPTANNFTYTIPKSTSIQFRVKAQDSEGLSSSYQTSDAYIIEQNVAPTVSITSPSNNQTLYENDSLNIAGTANDTDKDQSVTAYYQINNEPKKVLATNLSQTQIPLSKQLTFKSGKLYDGDTAISGVLADGVAHTLKNWAEDSEKASSEIIERAFYVVPNRAPLLTVDSVVPSGVVDTDKFKISGTASDQDANANVTVTRRINAGNAVEIYNGPGGAWEFEILLAQLVIGVNTIVIEVIDNYGAKTSKTIKLNKNEVKTPILHSVARYKIEPPKGTAKGVLLWVQRDEGLELSAELSMTLKGEQEEYVPLVATNTAPVTQGIVEDEFYHEAAEPKENIILKISMSRSSTTVNNKINLISGVLE